MKSFVYVSSTLLGVLVHSLCCLLPLLTALLGIGGYTGALGWVLKNQTYFLVVQIILLGWGFYRVYRSDGHAGFWHWEKVTLWLVTLVSMAAMVLPHSRLLRSEQTQLATEQVQRVLDTRRLTFIVAHAAGSSETLRRHLHTLPGVLPTQTSIRGEVVSMRYRHRQISRGQVLNALRQKGYAVREKPDELLLLNKTN